MIPDATQGYRSAPPSIQTGRLTWRDKRDWTSAHTPRLIKGPHAVVALHCLLIVILPLVFFAPYLGGRVVPFGDDILVLNYPLLALLAHALHAGAPLLWNPYSGGGYPMAPFSALPFYPPSWLLDLLPVTTAISWTYALDLAIGGLGAYALAAQLGARPAARLVPGIAFPFSGFVLAHIFAGHFFEVGLICWFPLALAALHRALDAPTTRSALRRGLLCGGPMGMLVLANGVSWLVFVAYPIGIAGLVLVVRALWTARRGGLAVILRTARRLAAALVATGVVAGLLGAAVLLPLRELLASTVRGGPMSFGAVTRISEPGLGLAMAIAPGLFGSDATHTYWFPNPNAYFQEVYAYAGLPVLVLALAGLVAGRRRRNVPLYGALAVLGVILALGANTPLYSALYRLAPGLDLARVPARWMLLAVLAVAVLAGVGADALLNSPARRAFVARLRLPARRPARRPASEGVAPPAPLVPLTPLTGLVALAVLLVLGLLGVALAAALPTTGHPHAATIGPALARLLLIALAVAVVLLLVPQLPRPAGATLLLLLVGADLWTANGTLIQLLAPAPYYQGAAVTLTHADEGVGRVWSLDRSVPLRLGMLDRQTRDIQDFAPLTLLDYWLVTHYPRTLAGVDTGAARTDDLTQYNARLAALLGVSLVISAQPLQAPGLVPLARLSVLRWGLLKGDWSHPGAQPGPAYAYRVQGSLPLALPIYATRSMPGGVPVAALFAPGFDPRRVALLDAGPVPLPTSNALLDAWRHSLAPVLPHQAQRHQTVVGPGVTQLAGAENSLLLRVTMRRAGVLLLDQVYDPGWTVTVDGHPAALRRADYLLTALALPAGTHTVTLVYAPPSWLAGAALTLLGYAVLLAAALAALRGWRRRSKAAPVPNGQ